MYGIVKQSNGAVLVESAPGEGSTFRVFLPATDGAPGGAAPRGTDLPAGSPVETILVLEDENLVRRAAARILRGHGYTVLEARSGAEALRLAEAHEGPIHLVLSDVVMPAISGPEALEALRALRPGLKALFMSAYADERTRAELAPSEQAHLLPKPFTPPTLLAQVRRVLDGRTEVS